MKIAVLGPRGTFSEEAARKFLPKGELLPCRDIPEVFERVKSGAAKYGVVPVENSLEGSVGITLEQLLEKHLKICGEIVLDIRHALMALPETRLEEVKEIISHPHALAQCKNFLKKLRVKTRNFYSTAEAAREIAEKKLSSTAALAPRSAARLYGLKILKENIQDENQNQTRFVVLAEQDCKNTGRDKTSLVFGLKDKPGALYEALGIFALRGINLTRIESRPSRRALGDYIFYLDFLGHRSEKKIKQALAELERKAAFIKILGSYPRGI